jgi:ElaB/YqjD/DUF883 family membrane-anchored ribosome-binding protein
MDQQLDERGMSETAEKAREGVGDLRNAAGAVVDRASDLARKASAPVVQAVDAIQGAARDVGQAANSVYQQGARAGGSVSQYTTEQPLTALVIAGALGYGLAYLIHRR